MTDAVVRDLFGALMVLVGLLLIGGFVFVGVRRTPGSGRDKPSGLAPGFTIVSALRGVTSVLAAYTIVSAVGATAESGISVGLFVGVIYAVLVIARLKTAGNGRVIGFVLGTLEGAVGALAIIPASIRYFQDANQCGYSVTPLWYTIAVFVLIVLSVGWAVARGALQAIRLKLFDDSVLSVFLAVFAAIEIAIFFMSPLGVQLFQLPTIGLLGSFAGMLVLLVGCLVSPRAVIAVGGAIVTLSSIAVSAAVGNVCGAVDVGGVTTLLLYVVGFGVTWLLLKKVFLDAILKVPDAKSTDAES